MLEVGATVGGKFRIEQILGEGGMGVVAVATHLQLEQRVALKIVHDTMAGDAEVVERFMREARASARLRSEHVCKVSDVGQLDSGAPYIVMELLDGCDLQAVIADGPLPIAVAVEYVLQACVAVAEAHALGIVHRDLKPANLFLTKRLDGTPLIKVLDFGIAKAASASDFQITRTSTIMGSPAYMSPEQLRSSRDVDARTDLWALGVILYELVSSRLPFHGDSITELAVKVVMDPPEPLAVDSPAFAAVVARCLEKTADQRYPTVAALAADLAPLGGERAGRSATLIATLTGERSAVITAAGQPAAAIAAGHATTLQTAAAQSTGTAIPPPPPRRRGLVLGGIALAAVAAAATIFVTRRDPGADPPPHAPLAAASVDASLGAAAPADAAALADAEATAETAVAELRAKVRALAATRDWYAVLQFADLGHDDPEIARFGADARAQFLAQQARAIDAQAKLGQCGRAKEIAAAARQLLTDDTTLEARAKACKPHVPPPAPPATIEAASQALANGDFARAFELADKLVHADPGDFAATRVAALAACSLKNVDQATFYAAKLHGADRAAARTQCRKYNIELGPENADPGGNTGSDDVPDAPDEALGAAQDAIRHGDWDRALSLAQAVLQRTPRSLPAVIAGVTAACHLKNEQAARSLLKRIPPPRQRALRRLCADEDVRL